MILVSGFEAFNGETLNPTHLLVDDLAKKNRPNVATVLLPVGFATAFAALELAIKQHKPTVVLALGQAGGRDKIEIERVAINLMDSKIPDNDGFHPRDQVIDSGAKEAFFSTLPLRELEAALANVNIPVAISNSAGLYVCNYLFFKLQQAAESHRIKQSGFVHFPYLPEQAASKHEPSMPFGQMQDALETMLQKLIQL